MLRTHSVFPSIHFSTTKNRFVPVCSMHSFWLLNALRKDPSDPYIYAELRMRLEQNLGDATVPQLLRRLAAELER